MDALVIEAVVGAGLLAATIATGNRKRSTRRPVRTPVISVARSIRDLRRRHRRAARAVVGLANACLERHPADSFEAFTAREALQRYLPETLAAYLAVPRELRRVGRGGRPCADDELGLQLRTLYGGLERLRDADAAIGETRMAANGAFLNERFASAEAPVSLGRRSVLSEVVDVIESALRRP